MKDIFTQKFLLINKSYGLFWTLFVVYGPTQDDLKHAFLAEMANTCSAEYRPFIRGDFNIMRGPKDKSNYNFNPR
jgi:hypothetical protein